MSGKALASPVYEIPISDDDLMIVGRITLQWAQIDFQVDALLMALHQIDEEQFKAFFGTSMIGRKMQALKAAAPRASSPEEQSAVNDLVLAVSACIEDRNLMTHGMWGWHWEDDAQQWDACAMNHSKKKRFSSSELFDLHDRIINATEQTDYAYSLIVWRTPPAATRNRQYLASPFPPEQAPGGLPSRRVR